MFITERELVNTLKNNYISICHWDTQKFNTKILEEVDLGFGVADLVISKLNPTRKKASVYLTYFDVIVYRVIETEKEISFDTLKNVTKSNTTTINRSLKKLIQDSYINKHDNLIRLNKTYKGISLSNIAIEAKLKNWRRALTQAFRYKWFADKSFVVLDSKHFKPALNNIGEFKKLNVGLAEISKEGQIVIHYKPQKEVPINPTMCILLNETLRQNVFRQKI
jgi:predicted transcriptional regulator